MNELFIISPKALTSTSPDEVNATVAGLKELGLYGLPYPKVDIQVAVRIPEEFIFPTGTPINVVEETLKGERTYLTLSKEPSDMAMRLIDCQEDGSHTKRVVELYSSSDTIIGANNKNCGRIISDYTITDGTKSFAQETINLLITLLATRNVQKDVRERKCLKLGIGKRPKDSERSYPRVTTISIPDHLEDDEDHPPTGRTVAPHLRRGHIRRQHYGPQMSFTKQVWIQPVFVNADESFVSTRKAYNLSL